MESAHRVVGVRVESGHLLRRTAFDSAVASQALQLSESGQLHRSESVEQGSNSRHSTLARGFYLNLGNDRDTSVQHHTDLDQTDIECINNYASSCPTRLCPREIGAAYQRAHQTGTDSTLSRASELGVWQAACV